MAQALGLLLAHEEHIRHVCHLAHGAGLLDLAIGQEALLQVGRIVEVVLDGGLAAVGDDQDLLDPGGDRLFYDVLQDGLIHQRQHLLRDALGIGQQAGAESRRGDDRFPDFHGLLLSSPASVGVPVIFD